MSLRCVRFAGSQMFLSSLISLHLILACKRRRIVTFRWAGWIAARLHSKRNCQKCISRVGFLLVSAVQSNFAMKLCVRRTIDRCCFWSHFHLFRWGPAHTLTHTHCASCLSPRPPRKSWVEVKIQCNSSFRHKKRKRRSVMPVVTAPPPSLRPFAIKYVE